MAQFLVSLICGLFIGHLLGHICLDDDTGQDVPAAERVGLAVLVAAMLAVTAGAVWMW